MFDVEKVIARGTCMKLWASLVESFLQYLCINILILLAGI